VSHQACVARSRSPIRNRYHGSPATQGADATAAEIGVDTLAERVAGEAIANGSVLVCRSEISAWSRVAAPA
jgi:hypothetical protein